MSTYSRHQMVLTSVKERRAVGAATIANEGQAKINNIDTLEIINIKQNKIRNVGKGEIQENNTN